MRLDSHLHRVPLTHLYKSAVQELNLPGTNYEFVA